MLTEMDLARIEQRARHRRVVGVGANAYEARLPPDETVLALVAALRAAWTERDRLVAASHDVLVAFEPIDWILPLSPDECHRFRRVIVALRDAARAALAAPGAGGQATEASR